MFFIPYMALGALLSMDLTKRLDKKGAVLIGDFLHFEIGVDHPPADQGSHAGVRPGVGGVDQFHGGVNLKY